jgi:hypothetical protein
MTSRFEPGGGRGGVPPGRRQNSPQPPALGQGFSPLPASVVPGSRNIFRGRLVIIFGTGPNFGLFIYAGQPGPGNPPVLWAVAPGVTADPSGNAVAPVLGIGTLGGPGMLIDQFGNFTTAGADGSLIELSPAANLPFALTSALSGVMQTLMTMVTTDLAETQGGVVSGIVLDSGAGAKMGTLITSPYGTTGMGMLLQAQNDGATDTSSVTFGTVATQGGTLTFQPVWALLPFAMVLYGSGATLNVVTKTAPGAYTIPIPAGVTTGKGECWGHGGNGGSGDTGPSHLAGGGGGGGGGEYASERALALPGGGNVTGTVGGNGATTTMTGSAATVTANPGSAGATASGGVPGAGGAGGTGSANTIHRPGGTGGSGGSGGGGGGGSSAGGANGTNGHGGSPTAGGAGGAAPGGGASGGPGGGPAAAGGPGSAPGGGQGGAGKNTAEAGAGAVGQARLTYVTGVPSVLMSVAAAATTDQFGTAIPAGTILPGAGDSNQYNSGPLILPTSAGTISSTAFTTLASKTVTAGRYRFRAHLMYVGNGTGATSDTPLFRLTSPAFASGSAQLVGTANGPLVSVRFDNASGFGSSLGAPTLATGDTATRFDAVIEGEALFTAGGTLAVQAALHVAGSAQFVIAAGSTFDISPVVAV